MNEFKIKNGLIVDQGGAVITGSLNVTQGITGSLLGTSSYATVAQTLLGSVVSASYAATASMLLGSVVSASYALVAQNVLGSITSASYSATASYVTPLTQTLTLTGSFNVSGSTTQIGTNNLLGQTNLSGSIIVSGTMQANANVTIGGTLRLDPAQDPGSINATASFLFTSASNTAQGYDLYYRQDGNLVKFKWLEGGISTGLLYGGVVSGSGSTIYVGSGSGIIMTSNANINSEISPQYTYVTWPAYSSSATYLTSSQNTYIYVDSLGVVHQQPNYFTETQYQEAICLGRATHANYTTITGVGSNVQTTYDSDAQQSEFIRAFGPLKINGLTITGQTGTLRLNIGAGQSYNLGGFYPQNPEHPSGYSSAAFLTASIARARLSGSNIILDNNAGAFYTVVDPTKYDDGSGVLQNVGTGNWTIQRVFVNPVSGRVVIYYGQTRYTTQLNALQYLNTDPFTEGEFTAKSLVFAGYLVLKGNTTDLTDSENTIIQSGIFRNTAGGSSTSGTVTLALDNLSDVTITTPTNGQALIYNSGVWENGTPISSSYAVTASYANNGVKNGVQYSIPVYTNGNTIITSSIFQSGSFTSIRNATAPEDPTNPDILYVNGDGITTKNLISAHGSINDYVQINVENYDAGTLASADVVATNDLGSYIDMGINSSGFNNPTFVGAAGDAYMYSTGENLYIGNATADKELILFNGGTNAQDNARMWVHNQGTVVIGGTGSYASGNPPALQINPLPGTTTYNIIQAQGNINDYAQIGVINLNTGSNSSTDIVAYNGSDPVLQLSGFIDMGINSPNYESNIDYPNWTSSDAYVYTDSPRMLIGSTGGVGDTTINFFIGSADVDADSRFKLRRSNTHELTGSLDATNGFIGNLTGTASFANSASYATVAQNVLGSITSASYAATASMLLGSIESASYATTASYATVAQTLLGSVVSASYAATASYVPTASYALTAQTLLGSVVSASYATTSSYSNTSVSSSYALTASYALSSPGGGGSPGGTTGQLQYNNAGAFAGTPNLFITGGFLATTASTDPGAPPAGSIVNYAKSLAGRILPKFKGPSGIDSAYQPALFGNTVIMWLPGGAATVSIAFGMTYTARNLGTSAAQSHPALTSTSDIAGLTRANFSTGTTATGASGVQTSGTVAWLGNATGRGGFFFQSRFGVETVSGTYRVAVGLSANNAALAAEPSTINNSIWLGKDELDTTWQVITKGAGTANKINTGITITAGQVLDLYIFSAPNSQSVTFYIKDAIAGTDLYVGTAITTNLPANTTFMYMSTLIQSVTGTTAKLLALNKMYLEKDF